MCISHQLDRVEVLVRPLIEVCCLSQRIVGNGIGIILKLHTQMTYLEANVDVVLTSLFASFHEIELFKI
jgi:hypothetical protein